ncbi:hypothetical protein [Saccharomonospora xinjiangensis]|uniref:hypothetical protein n=1 Tax=Saccharomonospora xinjiangensis TaxID=75294 RepID=UPI001E4F7CD1|nr:hypothetical protein [Saccharomonospora xinjiangensis]
MTRPTTVDTANPPRRRWRRAVAWSGTALAAYATTLSVASDTVYLLAIPGMVCLLVLTILAVRRVQRRRIGLPADADLRRLLRLHRAVVLRRYAALLALSAVLCTVPFVLDVGVLYPLVGVGIGVTKIVHYFLFGQLALLRAQSRVLSVYAPEFREPVRIVLGLDNGTLSVRLGQGQRWPMMVARGVADHDAGQQGIEGGGWFAGDAELGGVLATQGGDLLLLVPRDGKQRASRRSRADAARREKERRAGLDRLQP